MASSPPDSGWFDGLTLADVGHGVLDAAGLLPIVGEPADLANAAWLASEGDYLGAGLSVVSMVPIVGDAIGKGGKVLRKAGDKLAGPALDVLKKMDFEKLLGRLKNHPQLGPHVEKMAAALEKWRTQVLGRANLVTPTGTMFCEALTKRANKLAQRLAHATGDEAAQIADELARISTHNVPGADRAVLGRWPGYIDEAKKGGSWFETPPNFFDELKAATGSAEAAAEKAWEVNAAFLRQQLAAGRGVFEVTKEGLAHAAANPNSMMARELKFLAAEAKKYGYKKLGNAWVPGK